MTELEPASKQLSEVTGESDYAWDDLDVVIEKQPLIDKEVRTARARFFGSNIIMTVLISYESKVCWVGAHLLLRIERHRTVRIHTVAVCGLLFLQLLFSFLVHKYLAWVLSPWFMNLDMVPVSINFALSHSEIIFVTLFSYWLLKQRFGMSKIGVLCVIACGIALIAAGKSHSSQFPGITQMYGCALIIAAMLLWGLYEVLFKRWFGGLSVHGVMLVQTLWGLGMLLFGTLLLPLFWLASVEPVPSFSSADTVSFLATSALFAVSYFLAYPFALRLTSPFDVSLGSLVSIPVTAGLDATLWGTAYPVTSVIGMCIVCAGVLIDIALDHPRVRDKCGT